MIRRNSRLSNVQKLIASEKDDRDWQLRVDKNGIAYLSSEVGKIDTEGIAFRLETWVRGNGYVGAQTAQDQEWVSEIYKTLRENWPNPRSTFIDW